MRIIYALKCPLTKDVHYVGKSTQGVFRPKQHLTESHSHKVKNWVESLSAIGHKPDIEILERVSEVDNIDERERYYIHKYLNKGAILLNSILYDVALVTDKLDKHFEVNKNPNIDSISEFVKQRRKQTRLTQEEFADKSGIALTVIRKIEQYKTNVTIISLLKCLGMFGYTITITKK